MKLGSITRVDELLEVYGTLFLGCKERMGVSVLVSYEGT